MTSRPKIFETFDYGPPGTVSLEVRYNNSMLAMAKSFEIWYISIAFVEVNILSIFSLRIVSHKLAPLRLEIARQ